MRFAFPILVLSAALFLSGCAAPISPLMFFLIDNNDISGANELVLYAGE